MKATVIVDMQFGSCGKGLIAGYLAKRDCPDLVMHAWMPNSGHTYIDENGRKFVHCMIPNGVVSPNLEIILIGPGSAIDIDLLMQEAASVKDLLHGVIIGIHRNAAVVRPRHRAAEAGPMTAIGSTKKGCGAALIEKIGRDPQARITALSYKKMIQDYADDIGINVHILDDVEYSEYVHGACKIQVEGAQGYSLGINSGFYPYTTSRECTPAQIASDTLLPLRYIERVVGAMRTYPIRVANRYDSEGNMIGWSGPCYVDQREISFEDINQETELTTVTKLPRRVFTFSKEQTEAACSLIQPDEIFLNFANYCKDAEELGEIIRVIEEAAAPYGRVAYIGTGPTDGDVAYFNDCSTDLYDFLEAL